MEGFRFKLLRESQVDMVTLAQAAYHKLGGLAKTLDQHVRQLPGLRQRQPDRAVHPLIRGGFSSTLR